MTFGGQVDGPEARVMVDHALDAGINFLDTANNYTQGASEKIVGEVLQGRRDQVMLASKVFNPFGNAPEQRGLSHGAILQAVEGTLKRLRTDYLDVYYFHAPDYSVPLEESLRAMDELVRSGKVRYVGASNYASWQMMRLHWIAEREGLPLIRIGQPMYNLIARGIEQEYLPACRELGVANVVYNPLAGGLLTGKQNFEAPLVGSRFETNRQYVGRYWHRDNFAGIQALTEVANRSKRSLISIALNWLQHHSQAEGIIVGASSMEHLRANLDAVREGPLSEEVSDVCEAVWRQLRGVTPNYNR